MPKTDIFKNKRVLITGASAGIGRATAHALGARGAELFLLARREDRLLKVQDEVRELGGENRIHLLPFDVNDPELQKKIDLITEKKINILINNAGLALGREKVESSSFSDWQEMINTNITANFKLVNIVLPWMLQNGGGDILNLCSIAGHYTYPGGAVYCATKHAVLAFTRALREETAGRNLRVMQISPGMVNTEFSTVRFRGDKKTADVVYANMEPLLPEDIARMMVFMLEQPRHVVIDEIITMPTQQGSPTTVVRNSP